MASTFISKNGYRRFSDSGRLVHRWVAEKKIGRKLRDGEEVHHKNRNRGDNRSGNLRVFTGKYGFIRHVVKHAEEDY